MAESAQQPGDSTRESSRRPLVPWLVTGAVVVGVALVASVLFAVNERARAQDLASEVAALNARIEVLESTAVPPPARDELGDDGSPSGDAETPPPTGRDDLLGGGLEDLFGGELGDALGELLGESLAELFGGEPGGPGGGLEDLFGPGGGLEDLFDGGLGQIDDLLGGGDLLGGSDPQALAACVGAGDIGGLFGSGEDLTGSLGEQIAQIARSVEELRELRFTTEVIPTLLSPADFAERVAATVRAEYPAADADIDGRYLAALGAIPAGTDLLELQAELLAGQVAGFYDPDTGELVVPDDGDGVLDASERLILAHELDHALTDQALGLPAIDVPTDWDGNLARSALAEGDATLLMQRYAATQLSVLDQLGQMLDPDVVASQQQLDATPPYLRRELMFPYTDGLGYVCDAYLAGEWRAVDADYATPPASTAEILFPERADLRPRDAGDLRGPGGAWTVVRTDTIGVAQLLWLFEAPGGDESAGLPDAREAVRAWDGGEVLVATRGDDTAVGLALVDGSASGALCRAVDTWYGASFDDDVRSATGGTVTFDGGRQAAVLECRGDEVRLGIGPDPATAAALIS